MTVSDINEIFDSLHATAVTQPYNTTASQFIAVQWLAFVRELSMVLKRTAVPLVTRRGQSRSVGLPHSWHRLQMRPTLGLCQTMHFLHFTWSLHPLTWDQNDLVFLSTTQSLISIEAHSFVELLTVDRKEEIVHGCIMPTHNYRHR